jgi:SAM-dependent methyltransferase
MNSERARRVWSRISYSTETTVYLPTAGRLVEGAEVEDGDGVLDIGCGTGNVAITAARRGASVTGTDITPEMLEKARKRARVAGFEDRIEWREGDAIDLPFEDDAFDVTLSCLGHMYGDPPDEAARELLRVTRPGGHVGFVSWTPTSLYPSMAGVVSTYLSPDDLPDFTEPPFLWGDRATVEERLGDGVSGAEAEFETATVAYPALSPEEFWRKALARSGVFAEFLEDVDDEDIPELSERIVETVEDHFDGTTNTVELEYLLTEARVE